MDRAETRYQPQRLLGEGGGGAVWLARDRLGDRPVALKRVAGFTANDRARARREALVLGALRVPGVVALQDAGEDEVGAWLVCDYVDGEPFPGRCAATWAAIAPVVERLLEALAAVHAAGVVHRDLKPANVLVTPDGRPTIIDFGIARSVGHGARLTTRDAILGTPRYLAPEALFDAAVDGRADLYALGVMIWEALRGAGPYPDEAPITAKLVAAPRLADAPPPGMDPEAAAWVDALLAPNPDDRPASSSEALGRLRHGQPGASLPWVGRAGVLHEVLRALQAGRGVRIAAAPGMGLSRLLREVAARLAPRPVVWPTAGTAPFSSLEGCLGRPVNAADLPAAEAEMAERLRALGGVVLVDARTDLDRWSRRLLERSGAAVVHVTAEADLTLGPLAREALTELFDGPERLLRTRSGAATVLHARTLGVPGLVARELESWVATGRATRRGDRFSPDPTVLDQPAVTLVAPRPAFPTGADALLDDVLGCLWLTQPHATTARLSRVLDRPGWEVHAALTELERTGSAVRVGDGWLPWAPSRWVHRDHGRLLDMHQRVAATFDVGSVERCRHLVLGGGFDAVAREAGALAARARSDGQVGEVLSLLRVVAASVGTPEVLEVVADLTLEHRTPGALEQALRLFSEPSPWRGLLRAWACHDRGDRAGALAELAGVADVRCHTWRAVLEMDLAKADPAQAAAVIARHDGDPVLARHVAHWRGLVAYREGRFEEAAALHEGTIASADSASARCSSLLNAAAAWLEVPHPQRAASLAGRLLEAARAARLVRFEARAEWLLRTLAYREATAPLQPDLELVEAVAALGVPAVQGLVLVNEAAIAWRWGHPAAAELAAQAREATGRSGSEGARLLAGALVANLAGDPVEAAKLTAALGPGVPPGVAVQVLGLVGALLEEPPLARARCLAERFGGSQGSRRREVLSVAEAVARLER